MLMSVPIPFAQKKTRKKSHNLKYSFLHFNYFREAANIPLQQIPYYPPTTTTQQKGRPRKRKPLQSDETIINTSGDGPTPEHLHENRLGEFHVGNFIFNLHEVHTKKLFL